MCPYSAAHGMYLATAAVPEPQRVDVDAHVAFSYANNRISIDVFRPLLLRSWELQRSRGAVRHPKGLTPEEQRLLLVLDPARGWRADARVRGSFELIRGRHPFRRVTLRCPEGDVRLEIFQREHRSVRGEVASAREALVRAAEGRVRASEEMRRLVAEPVRGALSYLAAEETLAWLAEREDDREAGLVLERAHLPLEDPLRSHGHRLRVTVSAAGMGGR